MTRTPVARPRSLSRRAVGTAAGAAAVLIAAAVGACYREAPPPLVNRAAAAGADGLGAMCSRDDVVEPVTDHTPEGRLRSHVDGVLSGPTGRAWAGDEVPRAIPTRLGTLELFVLDHADGGYLALYREPYGLGSCQLETDANCAYEVRHYDARGGLRWATRLAGLLSRGDHLEVQDVRLAGGVLYFNEACQSYAKDADGRCSSLVAVDPRPPAGPRVLWRTAPLVSNGRFLVRGCYIVAGYGFTAELDRVHLVDRGTGRVVQSTLVSSSPDAFRLGPDDELAIELYSGATRRFRLEGMAGPAGRLVPLDPPEPGFGGNGYGGAGYGGGGYGGAAYGGTLYGGGGPNR